MAGWTPSRVAMRGRYMAYCSAVEYRAQAGISLPVQLFLFTQSWWKRIVASDAVGKGVRRSPRQRSVPHRQLTMLVESAPATSKAIPIRAKEK
jgi:hypothetical protein